MSESWTPQASMLTALTTCLGKELRILETGGAERILVGVTDGYFSTNSTMGPDVVQTCRRGTRLPLEVPLTVNNPDALPEAFAKAGGTWTTVHIEGRCPSPVAMD